jgi:hypothetical protein
MRPTMLALIAAAVVLLPLLGGLLWVLTHAAAARQRLRSLFRKPVTGARTVDERHYYRLYWRAPKQG